MQEIRETAMVYINRKVNSQKYYVIKVLQDDNSTEAKHVGSFYGRLLEPMENILKDNRKTNNMTVKSFSNQLSAYEFYARKIREKMQKGYVHALQRDDGKYHLDIKEQSEI